MKAQIPHMISVPPQMAMADVPAWINAIDGRLDEVQVMAGSLTFTTPADLCGLRALLDHAARHAGVVHVDCPTSGQVHRYLTRMNFYADLPDNVILPRPVPQVRRINRKERLVELSRINCGDDVQEFIGRAWDVTKGQLGSGPLAKACATALGAATENVLDHASSPIGALVAAQRYQDGLELAVVDLGAGIPTTLRRERMYAALSDLEAVERALDDKVTSTGVGGRGAGLYELVSAVGRTGNSTLVIRSRHAHLTKSVRAGRASTQRTTPSSPVPGTWISVRLQP
jgi:hypothetical protein